jgi:hypothetical protein
MLTGQLAIGGDSFGDILVKICTEPLPNLLASAPALPYAMEAWFQRACAREPASRCQSAQEFIDTLRAAAGTVVAPPRETTTPPLPTLQSGVTPGVLPAGAPAFAQSAAAVSVTAAGVPKRPVGPWIAVGILTVLFALGGAVLVAVAPAHRDAGTDSATAASAAGAASAGASVTQLAPVTPAAAAHLTGASADAGAAPMAARTRPMEAATGTAAPLAAAAAPTIASPVAASPGAASPPRAVPAATPTATPVAPATAPTVAATPSPAPTFRPVPLPKPAATINVGY